MIALLMAIVCGTERVKAVAVWRVMPLIRGDLVGLAVLAFMAAIIASAV